MSYVLPTACIRLIAEPTLTEEEHEFLDSLEFKTYYSAAYVVDLPRRVEKDEVTRLLAPLSTALGLRILLLRGMATNPFPGTWGDDHPDAETFRIHPRSLVVVLRRDASTEDVLGQIGESLRALDLPAVIWKYVRLLLAHPAEIDAMPVEEIIEISA